MQILSQSVFLIFIVLLTGCASTGGGDSRSAISRSQDIQSGMSYEAVLALFKGLKTRRTFQGDAMALQACSTVFPKIRDEYVTVWFLENRVSGLTSRSREAGWSCIGGMREVDWGQAPADIRIKID